VRMQGQTCDRAGRIQVDWAGIVADTKYYGCRILLVIY
jgi:hypothetical protein